MVFLTAAAQKSKPSIYRFFAGLYTEMEAQGFDLIKFTLGDPTEVVHPALNDVAIEYFLGKRGVANGQYTSDQIENVMNILEIPHEKRQALPQNYTDFSGRADLRERVANSVNQRHQINIEASNILFTAGANGAISLLIQCLQGPFLLHEPGFLVYHSMLADHEQQAMVFDTTEDGFAVNPAKLDRAIEELYEIHNNGEAKENFHFTFVFTDSGNPTGYKHSGEELQAILALFETKWSGANIIADSLYFELAHETERAISLLEVAKKSPMFPHIVFVDSLSKTDSASSMRGGYVVATPELVRAMSAKQLHSVVHQTEVTQIQLAAALESRADYVQKNAAIYAKKGEVLFPPLLAENILTYTPNGGFYAILDLSFMENVPLSQSTINTYLLFMGEEGAANIEAGVVGSNPFLAALELIARTGVFSVPVLLPKGPHLSIFSEDQVTFDSPKPLVRVVPALADELLAEGARRLVAFKHAVEEGAELPDSAPMKQAA